MSIRMVNVNRSNDESDGERGIMLRQSPQMWWMLLLFCIGPLFFVVAPFLPTSPHQPEPAPLVGIVLCWLMALFLLLLNVYLAIDLARSEIYANAAGLHWRRGFSKWKHARWDEVRDFYKQGALHIVQTPSGKLELSRSFVGIEQIIEMVPRHALGAPAPMWETRGLRRGENWSLKLSLWNGTQMWFAPLETVILVPAGLAFVWSILFGPKNGVSVSSGFWLDVFPAMLFVLLFGSVGSFVLWALVAMWRERQFAWRHRDETLHLDARGLVFSSSTKRIEAAWDEVRDVRRLPREGKFDSFEVETASGNFRLWSLAGSSVWRRFYGVARDYAPITLPSLTEQPDMADEIAPALDEMEGIKVWSFRSYGNRLLFLCVSAAVGFVPILYLISLSSRSFDEAPFSPSWPLFGGMCVVAVGTIAVMWIWFRRARIVADDEGLELYSPFRRARRIAWSSLEAVGHSVWGDWVRADGRAIYFAHALSPVRKAELLGVLNARKS